MMRSGIGKTAPLAKPLDSLPQMLSLRLVPDNRFCTSVMGPLATSQLWSGSLAVLEDMFEATILPDVQCWNVAAVRGSHSNWPRALSSVRRMEQLEVAPDVVTFSTAMGATFGSEWGWALMLLRHSADFGVERDCISYNVAMSSCADAGESCWTSALRILSALGESWTGPDATSIRTLLYALERARAWQQTVALLDCLDSFRVVPGTNLGFKDGLQRGMKRTTKCIACLML
eukprot:s1993_g3.t1